jgi:uncharacterized protein (UPF0332 family)
VSVEATRFLDKARRLLADADTMLGVGLHDAAGRTAYLAGFHAAQAFLFDTLGKLFKSHNGVQTEFLRLTRDDSRFPPEIRLFLSKTYNLKVIADYETGDIEVTAKAAAAAVTAARRFVTHLTDLVTSAAPPPLP